jgi:alkanesulfonate monooxygenase SsuD/methylene tetrahydromethanopterin reductase-like flavin-dependent oxidoreductase (luciferase family)
LEIGVYTFADITPDWRTGRAISVPERMREVLAAAKLADEVDLHVFGVGEHHRLDLAISAPDVVMAAIASATKRIRLTSAVTILSTADPVHVFENFATVDVISGGRAEIIVGRGAFVESFSLFGFDLVEYDALFAEKLGLLIKLNAAPRVTWEGRFRPPLNDAEISPRPQQGELPIWVGTGGNPESAANAARLGLPMTLANISLPPAKLAPQVADYKRIGTEAGHDPSRLRVGLAGHMHIEKRRARTSTLTTRLTFPATHPSATISPRYRARNTTSGRGPMARSSWAARRRSSTR